MIFKVMGENLVETFISPEFRPRVADVLSNALRGIQTANFEFPLITRPGTTIEILLNATPRNDLHGKISLIYSTLDHTFFINYLNFSRKHCWCCGYWARHYG